ncbi:hypothetical protein G6F23_010414 [Rhizopus arrhizus]|nr:hypothetical protein G6F23_010414 [Rhizopus arrhizus]
MSAASALTPTKTESAEADTILNETINITKKPHLKGHFSHPTPNGRQDVLAIKQQLADALGENGPLYWDALREFVMGKLNRQEFDFYANLYLSRQNGEGSQDTDPKKKRLKMDVMALSKAERERLKALVKSGDRNRLKPYVNRLMSPRVSRPISLPIQFNQLPQNYSQEYSKSLVAPLCIDMKELPTPEVLHTRMTGIALENGLLGGIGEDVVNIMLFAAESYIKSSITSAITKRRTNRCIGIKKAISQDDNAMQIDDSSSINLHDLAFSFNITPYVLVEKPLFSEKLTALLSDSEDEVVVDNLNEIDSDEEYNL